MIGYPIDVAIGGEKRCLYLRTRVSGDCWGAWTAAKSLFHAERAETTSLSSQILKFARAIEDGDVSEETVRKFDELTGRRVRAISATIEAAHKIVEMSMVGNYTPEEREEILGSLTDRHLCQIVDILETGDQPDDFFASGAIRQNASSTAQPGGGPVVSSSRPGGQNATSRAV
jgi:hypothetical protein